MVSEETKHPEPSRMEPEQGPRASEVINAVAARINAILGRDLAEQYFFGVLLTYSLIENLLKWLAFVKMIWNHSENAVLEDKAIKELNAYFDRLNLYNVQHLALVLGVIDLPLFERIDRVRMRRNHHVHELWLLSDKQDTSKLRSQLEELAGVANDLVGAFNRLVKEVGVNEVDLLFF